MLKIHLYTPKPYSDHEGPYIRRNVEALRGIYGFEVAGLRHEIEENTMKNVLRSFSDVASLRGLEVCWAFSLAVTIICVAYCDHLREFP